MEAAQKKERYVGAYSRLFPVKVSTNSLMTIYILNVLQKGKKYGKEIINEIEERFDGNWKPSHGLMYPLLRDLEKEGLVRGEWIGDSTKKTIRVYEITPKGVRAFNQEKETHKAAFASAHNVIETVMTDLYEDYQPIEWFTEEETPAI
ncbi:PadR family transcriptional regulator (plasmid) [Paenibacillus sp. EC2-1]|uniref:PadR family transcriptional regulator n=1 Tax=Paenibacillus sp. EC2-1 TaxID=3388665 RepID=UPI003BEEE93B